MFIYNNTIGNIKIYQGWPKHRLNKEQTNTHTYKHTYRTYCVVNSVIRWRKQCEKKKSVWHRQHIWNT